MDDPDNYNSQPSGASTNNNNGKQHVIIAVGISKAVVFLICIRYCIYSYQRTNHKHIPSFQSTNNNIAEELMTTHLDNVDLVN